MVRSDFGTVIKKKTISFTTGNTGQHVKAHLNTTVKTEWDLDTNTMHIQHALQDERLWFTDLLLFPGVIHRIQQADLRHCRDHTPATLEASSHPGPGTAPLCTLPDLKVYHHHMVLLIVLSTQCHRHLLATGAAAAGAILQNQNHR